MGLSGDQNGLNSGFDSALQQLGAVCNLSINSGFRTHDQQAALYAQKGPYSSSHAGAAAPGHSNHELGMAVDLGGDINCAHAHAAEFGLHFPMSNEPWHIEPVDLNTSNRDPYPQPPPHPSDPITGLDKAQQLLFGQQDPSLAAPSRQEVADEAAHHVGQMKQVEPLQDAAKTVQSTFAKEGETLSKASPPATHTTGGLGGSITDAVGHPQGGEQAGRSIVNAAGGVANTAGSLASAATSGASGGGQIDQFMAAIRQVESGGNYSAHNASGANGAYQFLPGTWRSANAAIGSNPNDWSPANQDTVARHLMLSYFASFGNWHDVAVAWNGGPGLVGHAGGGVQGYANKVMGIFGTGGGAPGADQAQPADQVLATPPDPIDNLGKADDLLFKNELSGQEGKGSLSSYGSSG